MWGYDKAMARRAGQVGLVLAWLWAGCNRQSEPAQATAAPAAPVAHAPAAPLPAVDARVLRWRGVSAPPENWRANAACDVLGLAEAPGLSVDAADTAMRPVATALRALPGVELVVVRARPGEVRWVVRFAKDAKKGRDAVQAVHEVWQASPPAGLATPELEAIARGARAMGALESNAMGGRPEATRYADGHLDAPLRATTAATRVHLAGAVRPLLALRAAPSVVSANGIALEDLFTVTRAWLDKQPVTHPPPADDVFRKSAHDVPLPRHWTANGENLPPAPLDRLVDISTEQGEPLREARNGHTPTTFWLIDAPVTGDQSEVDQAIRKVAADSKEVFKTSIQSFGGAYRFVLVTPEGKEPESQDDLSKRLLDLRQKNDAIVALNAFSGLDGIPEALDVDSVNGRRWTVFASIASADTGSAVFAIREALAAGGWTVHVLTDQTDPALVWVLDAWGSGGILLSAEDGSQLAPEIAKIANGAQAGRDKAALNQGPQPSLAPLKWRKADPQKLLATQLKPDAARHFLATFNGMQPLGWWHDTPVWIGLPVGDLAASVGQVPLAWTGRGGSGPGAAWIASDVYRVPDETRVVERVRVNGRPALWAAPDALADHPATVSTSFGRLVEAAVELRAGMRGDPLDTRERTLTSDPTGRPTP